MKLVILDRDGTLNQRGEGFITTADEWVAEPGALEAVARLTHAGWRVVVVTNQPGLGRGLFDVLALNAIHSKMHKQVAALGGRIDAVFFCPHGPEEQCTCRKPAPGLLHQVCERYGVEPRAVHVVGSCAEHVQAGAALGAQLHVVGAGQQPMDAPEPDLASPAQAQQHASLQAFADGLLGVQDPPTLAPAAA